MAGNPAPATDGTTAINNVLTQEANRITSDIHKETLHVSPWIDLIRKSAFPDGMGYQLNTLLYDRTLPQNDSATPGTYDQLGVNWKTLRSSALAANNDNIGTGTIAGSSSDARAPQDGVARIDFTRVMKQYSLSRALVHSPRINLDDLRFAAHRQDQLRAIMDLLKESVRRTWEDRHRDEYDRLCKNLVTADAAGSKFMTVVAPGTDVANAGFEGLSLDGVRIEHSAAGNADATPDALLSNKLMDTIYMRTIRQGGGSGAYGKENARPILSIVCSSEASYSLKTEAEYRTDIRENAGRVGELIAPLGVESSFRGFYHLIDDLAPRFTIDGDGDLTRVEPEIMSGGVLIPNVAYETASFEALYVLHSEVMECLVPSPGVSAPGLSYEAVNYRGDFKWTNIKSEDLNPDGTIGFFRGIMGSASKPLKTSFGYVVLYKRDSATRAA